MTHSEHYEETVFGFNWGGAGIERSCSDKKKGWVYLSVITRKHPAPGLQIYVTKSGKIRVYTGHLEKVEWLPQPTTKKGKK